MSEPAPSKYHRTVRGRHDGSTACVDVYDLLEAFGVTCPAVQHAVKKLLCPGQRGSKSAVKDLEEAAWSAAEAVNLARLREK